MRNEWKEIAFPCHLQHGIITLISSDFRGKCGANHIILRKSNGESPESAFSVMILEWSPKDDILFKIEEMNVT